MAALSAALAPTLRRLLAWSWPFGAEGCVEEWPELRSLHFIHGGTLADDKGPVRQPRQERLAAPADSLRGFAARRAALPALRVVELTSCLCAERFDGCPVVGCTHPASVALQAELRAAWPGLELQLWRPDDCNRL